MTFRSGIYVVPTDSWYIERSVWLTAGIVLLASTALARLIEPFVVLLMIVTGFVGGAMVWFAATGSSRSRLGRGSISDGSPTDGAPAPSRLYSSILDSRISTHLDEGGVSES